MSIGFSVFLLFAQKEIYMLKTFDVLYILHKTFKQMLKTFRASDKTRSLPIGHNLFIFN